MEPRRFTPSTDRPAVLDVGARLDDVRRLTLHHRAAFARCLAAGWDEEDLIQEVATRIAARQTPVPDAGGVPRLPRSAYDPVRAGVGKYLFTSTRTILANLAECRRYTGSAFEQLSDDGFVEGAAPPDPDPPTDLEVPVPDPSSTPPAADRPPRRRTAVPAPGELVAFVASSEAEPPSLELNVTGLAVRIGDRSVEVAALRLSAPPATVLQLVTSLVARASSP